LVGLGSHAEIEQNLAEWDYGDYEGQRTVDIRKGRPVWNVFQDGCPGGELPAQISDRADRLIAQLGGLRGNIALFSHGQFGCVLAARWIGLAVVEGQHLALGPASVSILGYSRSHPDVRIIGLWNITPALLEAGPID
jgi:probable phosphoglycerate mutase